VVAKVDAINLNNKINGVIFLNVKMRVTFKTRLLYHIYIYV
jgi:hypothetical protein